MSITRKVELKDVDLDLLEEVAEEKGFRTSRNTSARMYYEKTAEKCDLVINVGSRDIGFVKKEDSVQVMMDHMDGEKYGQVMGTYFERLIEKRTRGKYSLVDRVKSGSKLKLVLRRA